MAHLQSGGEPAQGEEAWSSVLPHTDELRDLGKATWPMPQWPHPKTEENGALCACKTEMPDQLKSFLSFSKGAWWKEASCLTSFLHQGELQLDSVCLLGWAISNQALWTSSYKGGASKRAEPDPLFNPLWLWDEHIYSSLKTQFQKLSAQAE